MANTKTKPEVSAEEMLAAISASNADNVVKLETFADKQEAMWAKLEELAANAAGGMASAYEMSILFQESVRDKLIAATDNVKFYQHYFDTVKAKLAERNMRAGKEGFSAASFNSQCSKLKSFGNAAAVHLGEDLYATIDRVWNELPAEKRAVSMSASYARINVRALELLKSKDCGGNLAKMESIVLGKNNWLEYNLSKNEENADEDGKADDEKSESLKTPLDKLADIAANVNKLAKKDFAENSDFAQFAAYVSAFHAKMVSETHKGAQAPVL